MDIFNEIVLPAFEECRHSAKNGETYSLTSDSPLMGSLAIFDSLSFVSFIVVIEEKISDKTGQAITLVDDKAFASKTSPFRTVGTLCEYITQRIS